MALTPWNRQEEWYQQMINASTGNYLPSISAQDAGKVMTVESDGSWGVENIPQELPTVGSSNKDKYLHTNASNGNVEWANAPTELPSVTSADETKVLTVDSNGDWVAADAPSGLPSTTSASAGDVLSLNNSKEAVWTTPSSGGGGVVHAVVSDGTATLDKTWQEIFDGDYASVSITSAESSKVVCAITQVTHEATYYVTAVMGSDELTFEADAASGYPSMTMG